MPRERERFDYKTYNATGKKVAKENRALDKISENFRNLAKMELEKLDVEDKRVGLKITRFTEEYDFDLLFDVEDIKAGIAEFKKLIDMYEEIHVELKRQLKDNYEHSYPDFEDKLKTMTDWVKTAKLEIKRKKVERSEKDKQVEREERRREREKLKTEERYFAERINQDLINISEKGTDLVENMEKSISDIKILIRGYSELFIRIEDAFGADFEKEFEGIYGKMNLKMNNLIRELMDKIRDKRVDDVNLISLDEKVNAREREQQICTFNGIFENIKERAALMESKCLTSLNKLSDSQILEKMKDSKMLDSEYNQILDWVTELVKAAPTKYDKTNETLDTARNAKKQVKESLLQYQKDLEQEVKNRDLGSNKIRDSSILSLEVPKYRGYGSPLDFYTFKSEFEKLISPKIHARLLPDYLKNNYLGGQAFVIVSEIWEIDTSGKD